MTRIVTYDEYCEMSEKDQKKVKIVSFTGLTDLDKPGSLGAAPEEGGTNDKESPQASE